MELLNSLTEFIDQNIRIVRYSAPVLAVVGTTVILHHTHAFTVFKTAKSIPAHIVERNLPFRGITKDVINGRTIKVQHIPIFFRNLEKRQKYFGEKILPMDVALAGLLPKDGCVDFIMSNLLHKNIKIIPLKTTEENYLEAVVYLKKSLLSQSICINKELVAKGLAVVHHNKELTDLKAYITLSKQLLTAEVKADKIGVGIWKRPPLKERTRKWWEMLKQRARGIFSRDK